MIKEYTIITEQSPNELIKKVNEMIKEGWQPLGGFLKTQSPIVEKMGEQIKVETRLSQTMVKY